MRTLSLALALLPLLAGAAQAHVTLENPVAEAGRYVSARFMVPHTCAGSPAVKIRVRLPESVSGVTPMVHPGWQIDTVMRKLDKPVTTAHGVTLTEGVGEVAWSGGKLLDHQLDVFTIRFKAPDAPDTTLYFPTIVECEAGVDRWIDLPSAEKTWSQLPMPAPFLRLVPATSPDPITLAQ